MIKELKVVRAAEVEESPCMGASWLVEELWGAGAVGVIGGAPKCGKTFLALELAVAVASGRPCLGRFGVPCVGPSLVYAAEDEPRQIRQRLAGLAQVRGTSLERLEVRLIVEPVLRLDRAEDVARLRATLAHHRPRMLVLDPYVRLQRVDENNVTEVAAILGALRELSRSFEVAVVLVHHTRKNPAEGPGQALRGSSDFYAWADSVLYLVKRGGGLTLLVEHRAAPSPPALSLELVATDAQVRLEVRSQPSQQPLAQRVLQLLAEGAAQRHRDLRQRLGVRDGHLSAVLQELEAAGEAVRTPQGWAVRAQPGLSPVSSL